LFHGGSKVAGEKGTVEAQKAKRYREKDGWGEKERRKKGEKEVEKGIEAHTVHGSYNSRTNPRKTRDRSEMLS